MNYAINYGNLHLRINELLQEKGACKKSEL